MHNRLKAILPSIEQQLSSDEIMVFKIGKSDDPAKRFNQYEEPYHYLDIIAKGDASKINKAEIDLINWATTHECLSIKCLNENNGGGGNPDATMLYIVSRRANAEAGEHLLTPTNIINEEIINL